MCSRLQAFGLSLRWPLSRRPLERPPRQPGLAARTATSRTRPMLSETTPYRGIIQRCVDSGHKTLCPKDDEMKSKNLTRVLIACLFIMISNEISAQWYDLGNPVFIDPGMFQDTHISYDGNGGLFFTWCDWRNGGAPYQADVYAQYVNADGIAQFGLSGMPIDTISGNQYKANVSYVGGDCAVIVWSDLMDGYKLRAQRINSEGMVFWGDRGVDVSEQSGMGEVASVIPDINGGAIISWRNFYVWIQRLDSLGNRMWGEDGIRINNIGDTVGSAPAIVSDGAGGAIIVWSDYRSGSMTHDIYAQRVNSNGDELWTDGGLPINNNEGAQTQPSIVFDGNNSFISWFNNTWDIGVQKIDHDGNLLWNVNGVYISPIEPRPKYRAMAADNHGGVIAAWEDFRNTSSTESDIYAQRIRSDGEIAWDIDGIAIYIGGGDHQQPAISTTSSGDAIIVWTNYYGIYAQRVDTSGAIYWPEYGENISRGPGCQHWPLIQNIDDKELFVVWNKNENDACYGNDDLYVQKIDLEGHIVGTFLDQAEWYCVSDEICLKWSIVLSANNLEFIILRTLSGEHKYREVGRIIGFERQSEFCYIDSTCKLGEKYIYRVIASMEDDEMLLFETTTILMPNLKYVLHQNYPNPFNPITKISYSLPKQCIVSLKIYDIMGKEIVCLVNNQLQQGEQVIHWDGKNHFGDLVSSGTYFCKLFAGKQTKVIKLICLR